MVKQDVRDFYFKYGAIALILLFAAVQFILIIRHKSLYTSDSYFYKQIYYQLKGDSYNTGRQKILNEFDLSKEDKIVKKIFEDKNTYDYAYGFFVKRPLYPFLAFLISFISPSTYLNFLIPIFLAYMGVVIFVYYFSQKGLGNLFGIIATALFVSFYPFLDLSARFMTDTLGAFFWLVQLFLIYKFIQTSKSSWLISFTVLLFISLLNREQSMLIMPLLLILSLLFKAFNYKKQAMQNALMLFVASLLISLAYIVISTTLGLKNILDTLAYTQNSYGYQNNAYSLKETLTYLIKSVFIDHIIFAEELVQHHWWFLISLLSILGLIKTLTYKKLRSMLDVLIITSGIASYLSIFIYPVLSYRYFFPVLFTIVYFAAKFTKEYFEKV